MTYAAALRRPAHADPVESAMEVSLVERARAGDGEAFRALVSVRVLPTFRLARAILGTTEEAEDATQEAFLAAWRGIGSLRDPARFDAWFGRIVANACRMSVRRRPQAVVISVEEMGAHDEQGADDHSLAQLPEIDALQRAIDRLSVPQRTILALYHLQDRSVAEVGAILGIPVGTAKWRLSQARAALERAFELDA
jgi:RNA polymerase sigma-70 factor (ECF subfamily)